MTLWFKSLFSFSPCHTFFSFFLSILSSYPSIHPSLCPYLCHLWVLPCLCPNSFTLILDPFPPCVLLLSFNLPLFVPFFPPLCPLSLDFSFISFRSHHSLSLSCFLLPSLSFLPSFLPSFIPCVLFLSFTSSLFLPSLLPSSFPTSPTLFLPSFFSHFFMYSFFPSFLHPSLLPSFCCLLVFYTFSLLCYLLPPFLPFCFTSFFMDS